MLYNVIYTGGIPIIVGLLEQNMPAKALMENPIFYQRCSQNKSYTTVNLFLIILDACEYSLCHNS